jgi:hypothetical protein
LLEATPASISIATQSSRLSSCIDVLSRVGAPWWPLPTLPDACARVNRGGLLAEEGIASRAGRQ